MGKKSVLVACAHSDDEIFGPGGTLAKYAKQGLSIYTVIFSYGEKSHPQLKKNIVSRIRQREALLADKLIGGKGVFFLGLREGRFEEDFKKKNKGRELRRIINKTKPIKIFVHSKDDPLPDHRKTRKLFLETYDRMKFKTDVYSFNVWNLFNIRKEEYPRLVVDITDTFKIKLKALECFKSQRVSMLSLKWSVYVRAFFSGLSKNYKFAEVFYKIR